MFYNFLGAYTSAILTIRLRILQRLEFYFLTSPSPVFRYKTKNLIPSIAEDRKVKCVLEFLGAYTLAILAIRLCILQRLEFYFLTYLSPAFGYKTKQSDTVNG